MSPMDQNRIRSYIEAQALDQDSKRRILMTLECGDADDIVKVAGAGEVFEENGRRFQLMHNGVRVLEDCYYGKWMTELIRLLRGHHEPQEEKVFHSILKYISPAATMIELGGFWSYYSLWFQMAVPGATTYVIEPDPNNLEVGRRNFELNGCKGHFYQYAIAAHSGVAEGFRCESDGVVRRVPQISVDDFIEQNQIKFVDLLLADVQGADLQVLEGASKSIAAGKIRFLSLSTHHHSISGDPILHQRCLQLLKEKEAHFIAAHNVSESYSGDGLIVASLRPEDRGIPLVAISKNHSSNSLFRETEFDLQESQAAVACLTKQVQELQDQYERQGRGLKDLNSQIVELNRMLSEREGTLTRVLNSTSWKVTRPVREMGQLMRKITTLKKP